MLDYLYQPAIALMRKPGKAKAPMFRFHQGFLVYH